MTFTPELDATLEARSQELFESHRMQIFKGVDRTMAFLMLVQWVFGIVAAIWISPRTWIGVSDSTHIHVYAAIFLGGAISAAPIVLTKLFPGEAITRHVMAVSQMLWSALLIHLTGGRIETHFHVFGSLAFLAFYRDWKVLVTATIVVGADHFLRGSFWPQSVFGLTTASPWRWMEHVGWVVFEDIILIQSCRRGVAEMREISQRQARAELAQEITEREVADRTADLTIALDAAHAANRAKSEFLANMSHEIRTPMNGVIGMTELLMNTHLVAEQYDFARTIQISAESLLTVINDILDFSKIEAGKLKMETIECSIGDIVEEVGSLFAPEAHRKELELLISVPVGLPMVKADPVRIRQILTNLTGNAIKFTEKGEVVIGIELLRTTDTTARMLISVEDTGIGIPADRQAAIFDSFTQADGSTTRRFGGSGLGLTISRTLVQLMGGKLTLSSEVGRGSRFDIQLDLPLGLPRKALKPDEIRGLRVLVVDDNATNRRILEAHLDDWGCAVTCRESGDAALEVLRSRPFDLILTDYLMPEMDGLELSRRIRQEIPEAGRIPVVLISSAADIRPESEWVELGLQNWVSKPIRLTHLLLVVQQCCGELQLPVVSPVPRKTLEGDLGLNVLLAEDNSVNLMVATRMLTKLGCSVTVAANGVEAVELSGQERFDIILMDVQMPVMDGLDATRGIREREQISGEHTYIVAMTAGAMEEDRTACLDAGMDDYISKPVNATTFREKIEARIVWTAAGTRVVPDRANSN